MNSETNINIQDMNISDTFTVPGVSNISNTTCTGNISSIHLQSINNMNSNNCIEIELFENERYGVAGWSANSLLLTDRSNISNRDGSISFQNLEEANKELLSIGYEWIEDSNWTKDNTLANTDEDNWTYHTDFTSMIDLHIGSNTKSLMHFVRRRRLIRYQRYNSNLIYHKELKTCDYCDYEELEQLSNILFDILVDSSLKYHPRFISLIKMNHLKSICIESLFANHPIPSSWKYSHEKIVNIILDELQANHKRGLWTIASTAIAINPQTDIVFLQKRKLDIQQYFPEWERHEIAKCILQKYDLLYEYHCNIPNCSITLMNEKKYCCFITETCPNKQCNTKYSTKYATRHDSICLYKVISCTRQCGDDILRKDLNQHLDVSCKLRPVTCSFHELGCSTTCEYRHLSQHMEDYMQSHLLLTLSRIEEQQKVIISLHRLLNETRNDIHSLDSKHVAISTGLI